MQLPKRQVVIFDLDGTLANTAHRKHFVERNGACVECGGYAFESMCPACDGTGKDRRKPDWNAFFRACVDDTPLERVAQLFRTLKAMHEIWIFSGRSNLVEQETIAWLKQHNLVPDKLVMRVEGDYTADEVLKRAWYEELVYSQGGVVEVLYVFDDRDKVVKAWRELGLQCFQVAPGDF